MGTNAVDIIKGLTEGQIKTDLPKLEVGDTLNVHCRIVEGSKERIQVFQGVLIGIAGGGVTEMITVRRIVDNMGVERIFPIHSPKIAKIDVIRKADARRAKLYFLRERAGKSRRLRDKRRGLEVASKTETAAG
jgi:large subunit ribosomal protein L19